MILLGIILRLFVTRLNEQATHWGDGSEHGVGWLDYDLVSMLEKELTY